ncbi:hypothetical protein BMQ_pBM30013 (plasmid) [Priestia megaterium QM B1551]|uniref:Uncharacterized protein n=1 Tax=Priestia megaterium (strain ATCC 12872 / QMB1551) TaxID=545693 RepID=D5E3A5_PRIM1|nr:hypothetical protein BMQ_pBM30013 [Priestia megaterium QM B1551]
MVIYECFILRIRMNKPLQKKQPRSLANAEVAFFVFNSSI